MKRIILTIAAAGGLVAAGAALGRLTQTPRLNAVQYAYTRLAVIQQHLDEAEPGYVLLVGDSNAELQSPSGSVCGASIVNAGISGATTSVYVGLFARLAFPVRPRAAVLTIGTNNLDLKNAPRSAETAARYERDIAALVTRLQSITDTVLVTALPPIGRELEGRFDEAAIEDYARRIETLCGRLGCRAVDPFADLRDAATGFGLSGVNSNGRHLARYKPTLRGIGAALCPSEGPRAGGVMSEPATAP